MDNIAVACGRSFFHWLALIHEVTASGSVHSFSYGSVSMGSDSSISGDEDMEINDGSNRGSNSQVGHLVVMNYFLNE